jgi:hypothetical protein
MHLHFSSEKGSDGRLSVGRQGVSRNPATLSGRFVVIHSGTVTVVPGDGGKVANEAKKAMNDSAMNVLARWSGLGCFDLLFCWEQS